MNKIKLSISLALLIGISGILHAVNNDQKSDWKVNYVPYNLQSGWVKLKPTTPPEPKEEVKVEVIEEPIQEVKVTEPEPVPVVEPDQKAEALDSLKDELSGAVVSQEGDEIKLTFEGKLLFGTGSSEVKGLANQDIATLANILHKYNKAKVRVEGHTDSLGAASFNQNLSEKRAKAVAESLKTEGIGEDRIIFIGHGEAKPVADNKTRDGRQANRRVEIFLSDQEQ